MPTVTNPFFDTWTDPFETPPFHRIEIAHFSPAFHRAMIEHCQEIESIAADCAPPDFANTVAALEQSGHALRQISAVFFALHSAETNDQMQEIARRMAPSLAEHADRIRMNEALFARIDTVFQIRETLALNVESTRLLEKTHRDAVRGGALLPLADKARLMEINARLSVLELTFQENLLKENNAFQLVITEKRELKGLPESSLAVAAETASRAGLQNAWIFTLHRSSWTPFMLHCAHREHRRAMFNAWQERASGNNNNDNKAILREIVTLRQEKAAVLGYENWAAFILEENMARTPVQVEELLHHLWQPATANARAEKHRLEKRMHRDGVTGELAPWDWWYYAERLREEEYAMDDAALRNFFALGAVQTGAFETAQRLFSLKFSLRCDIPVYHSDVRVVEVTDSTGTHVGLLYLDYFQRPGKSQGAWMTEFRTQEMRNGTRIAPLVVNVFNFTRPLGDAEALLSLEEVETLFHEFGHALHALLSNVTWASLAGTNVARDFVELPSQFMENWAVDRRVMRSYARHHKTGEIIPDEMLDAIERSRRFNQGFETTEYLAAAILDMAWHKMPPLSPDTSVTDFEHQLLAEKGLLPQIAPRYRSTYFAHIFSGGYSAGYYSYIWAAVLDADAFAAFTEKPDLFDADTAALFADCILSKGDADDPMVLFRKFRGRQPDITPLLARRGLQKTDTAGIQE